MRTASPIPVALVPFKLIEDLAPKGQAQAKEVTYDYDIADWKVSDVIRVVWDFDGASIVSGTRVYCFFNQQASQWHALGAKSASVFIWAKITERSGRAYSFIEMEPVEGGTFEPKPDGIIANFTAYEINKSSANFDQANNSTGTIVMAYPVMIEVMDDPPTMVLEWRFDRGLTNPNEGPRYNINPASEC